MEKIRLGVLRPSMKDNQLLVKSELGKTRRRCYTIPGPDFIYGIYCNIKDGGVAEAIGHWNSIKPISEKTFFTAEQDFVALNREAVKAGLVTPAEHYNFRTFHDMKVKIPDNERFKIRKAPPDMTFGIPTRPSTPMFELLEHKYGECWIHDRKLAEKRPKKPTLRNTNQGKIFETRASILRKYQPPVDPQPLWHLPRFQRTLPHLDTFANPDLRNKALNKALNSEKLDSIAKNWKL
ncbi:cilia- and flagella-associated protein 77 [Latimeria chalumnae]|uniref:Cilia and flagella associated protein 77 n=1 Tax=Latimeria chalumnae TaxID=7897 RepID=M3XK00_LATCH|nr:PREDICTED: uncharacterized protein C9orf171 homolog [Latimeria chalumnae]|eukprot:XP_014341644.1 PREDICTED: uncharacterized protein C9orf171 homolog [Latimeria chalumnae]